MMTGRTIAHYQVLEKLGEGGMGVVYKARDTHLDRFVALKVLPPEKVADPERKRRFVQEAKAASALNHPNIVTIYDIGTADGTDFIAMEYVPGRTLNQLIGGKGLKLNTALGYAVQMADALAKAHAAGIVHRDLKPSNVMVNDDDVVKILDFGLAKLAEPAESDELAPTATMGQRLTEEGAIVGTVAYMSPEQAQGIKVDARSDIFSFGAVLYEMLAGQQTFSRGTRVATLAAILKEEPAPLKEIAPGVPAEVERVVDRCLRKDPQRRWQSLSDLKLVLQDLKEESESGKLSGTTAIIQPRLRWRRLLIPVMALVVVGLAGLGWWMLSRRGAAPAELEISRLTLDPGLTFDPAISPDGKLAAYSSDREDGNLDIYVQQIAGRQPIRLTRHEAAETQPNFSPDGSRIAYRSERDGGGIYVIDTLGGEERKIADRGYRPRFSPDGSTISYVEEPAFLGRGRIHLVPAQGGVPRRFLPEYEVVGYPNVAGAIWSPDGRFLLFQGIRNGDPKTRDWWVAPVDGGPPIATGAVRFLEPTVGLQFQYPCAWTGRYVILIQGTTNEGTHLYRLPIAPGSWKISGAPQRLTSGPGIHLGFTMASDGRVLFSNIRWVLHFWTVGLDPIQGRVVGDLQPIAGDDAAKYQPALSRDGSRLAFGSFAALRGRAPEVRVREMASGRETTTPASGSTRSFNPQLSADGSVLAYSDQIGGKWVSYIVADGGGSPQQVCENCIARGFFSDPREMLLEYVPSRLVRQNLATGNQVPVLPPSAGAPLDVALAPDDRWLALLAGKPSGSLAIYVVPLKNPPAEAAEWGLVAEDPRDLRTPRWSADGNFLYYLSQRDGYRCVWAQRLDRGTRRPTGPAFAALHLHRASPGTFSTARALTPIAIARDKMVLVLSDVTGNIWMSRLGER